MARRTLISLIVIAVLAVPVAAAAQVVPPEPPLPWPCPDCFPPSEHVVIEDYRVETTITDQLATTVVTQVFRNDGNIDAEGIFLYPLPPGAAMTGLTLWIDGEPVSGEVLPAGEARATYEEIVAFLRDPALLEFADQGLVRASVYPVPPGGERRVQLEYTEVLLADGGLVRFHHPLGREVSGLAEIEHLTARIEITAGSELKAVYSPTHGVDVSRPEPNRAVVGYESDGDDTGADFILYYSTDDGLVGLDVISFRDGGEDGFFLLLASPGIAVDPDDIAGKDVILILDRSGSMEGDKFAQALDAAGYVLDHLNEGDRFNVITFATEVDSFAARMQHRDEAGTARDWLEGKAAAGSTAIDRALLEAFRTAGNERPTYVLFLTDGLPTEGETRTPRILENAAEAAPDNVSLFAFGVGWDVDTILLDSLAEAHQGTTTYVVPGEDIDAAVSGLYAKISTPVLTGIDLDFGGAGVYDVYPTPLPDLFSGGQLALTGRYRNPGTFTVTLTGEIDGETQRFVYAERGFRDDGGAEALPRLWATRKIGNLLRSIRIDGPDDETIEQIVRLSVRYGIVTPYTSYLVTEPAPFGEAALREIVDNASAPATTMAPSGEDAVEYSAAAGSMAAGDMALPTDQAYADVVASAGSRAFRLSEGIWTDTAFDPDTMAPVVVPFLSDDYFALAAADPELAAALAVAERVIVVWDGTAYEVAEAGTDAPPVTIPDPATTTTTAPGDPGTTMPGTDTTQIAAAASEETPAGFPLVLAILLGTLVLATGLATGVVMMRRREQR